MSEAVVHFFDGERQMRVPCVRFRDTATFSRAIVGCTSWKDGATADMISDDTHESTLRRWRECRVGGRLAAPDAA